MWGLYTCKIVSHFIHITYNISSSSTPQVPAHIIPPPFNTTLIQKSSRLLVLTHICGGEIASLTLIFCCQNVGWRVAATTLSSDGSSRKGFPPCARANCTTATCSPPPFSNVTHPLLTLILSPSASGSRFLWENPAWGGNSPFKVGGGGI